ncbi:MULTISPECIES: hypothetical protein [unclassified Fibrobacter]|uniref:hypothetical protein n=1 Tax=unclassified Fibrobacter TaxID=2634177 RepID=UPI000D6C792A|nr:MULTISPECIES: hypothetical protein [unclassified Fibrobacter]PWJ68191.1 hypothetical protein BGX12_10911 [Fibrobacter sp. UWR4]PZW72549.1 hypothetical protein C8E88_100611 [Fibrobacter sp. UWR1]
MIELVLCILLVATILATNLLNLPGGVKRQIGRFEKEVEEVYLEESAIIAWMEQFPADYFARKPWNLQLPEVQTDDEFPWMNVSAGKVTAQVGSRFRPLGRDELREVEGLLEAHLKREILGRSDLKVKSGSRRLYGRGENIALSVTAGDLTLGFDGDVGSVNLKCDGDINVGGVAQYDTLRLHASGNVTLRGSVSVDHLEVYSGGDVELSRTVSFSGVVYSRGNVSPTACADTTGVHVHLISQYMLSRDGNEPLSPRCILPASVGGKMQALSWRLN